MAELGFKKEEEKSSNFEPGITGSITSDVSAAESGFTTGIVPLATCHTSD